MLEIVREERLMSIQKRSRCRKSSGLILQVITPVGECSRKRASRKANYYGKGLSCGLIVVRIEKVIFNACI